MKKIKNKKLLILAVAVLIFFYGAGTANAVSQTSTLTTSVAGKSLTLAAPVSATMSTVDVSADSAESAGEMNGVQITDLRGKKTPLGWSLTATATDFITPTDDKIPVSQFLMSVSSYVFVSGKDGGITVPGSAQFADANNDGTSDAVTLIFAAAGFGAGRFVINPILQLTVPPFSVAGTYTSTIVLTLS